MCECAYRKNSDEILFMYVCIIFLNLIYMNVLDDRLFWTTGVVVAEVTRDPKNK